MNKNSLTEALRTLATSDKSRSETARLRDVIDDVEIAIGAGVSHTAVLETLHEQGFTMTAKSFESALYRLRKKRNKGSSGRNPASQSSVAIPKLLAQKEKLVPALATTTSSESLQEGSSTAGKQLMEHVLNSEPKEFSLKQQQKEKSQP